MLRAVENKIEIIILSLFVGKKLEFSKFFNIFVILAYKLHNRILILEKIDDVFLKFFYFFEMFWMIPNDKYCYMFLTHEKHHKSQFLANVYIF